MMPTKPFTKPGDSGALVTGIGYDDNAYGVHISGDGNFEFQGERFNASFMIRLDSSLGLLCQNYKIKLDFDYTMDKCKCIIIYWSLMLISS